MRVSKPPGRGRTRPEDIATVFVTAQVGALARLLLREKSEAEARARDWGAFTSADWDANTATLRTYLGDDADLERRVSCEQFLLCELLRSGSVSGDLVEIILDKFHRFDADGDRYLTKAEFLAHKDDGAASPRSRTWTMRRKKRDGRADVADGT